METELDGSNCCRFGFDLAQSYLYGRPTPVNTFEIQVDRRTVQLEISRQSSGALLDRRLELRTGIDGVSTEPNNEPVT